MKKYSDAKRYLYFKFNNKKIVAYKMNIKRYLGLCCLGIKENFERTGYFRKAIRSLFEDVLYCGGNNYHDHKPSEEKLENILDFITEKPTVAALIIGCGEGITKFLNPTDEEIKESKDIV